MAQYTGPYLMISGAGTFAVLLLTAVTAKENLIATVSIASVLKILICAITVLLFRMIGAKHLEWFYINIGLHPRKLLKWAISADAAVYITACTMIIILKNVLN